MDQQAGIFPRQANGPIESHHGEFLAAPLAVGKPSLLRRMMMLGASPLIIRAVI